MSNSEEIAPPPWPTELVGKNVVFLDGECVVCQRSAHWLARRDLKRRLHFASLQGPLGRCLEGRLPPEHHSLDSVVFARGIGGAEESLHTMSSAALMILRELGGFWTVVSWLQLMPRPLRDFAYRAFAKRRYRLFGKKADVCPLPEPDRRERFLM